MTPGIVIVGAGFCGVSAAFAARDAGYTKSITIMGDELESPYERPPLSKWGGEEPELRLLATPETYVEKDITLRLGSSVLSLSPHDKCVALQTGEIVGYEKLLIATGARPRRIDQSAALGQEFHYLRSYANAKELSNCIGEGHDVVIIGGGFIGLELAASLVGQNAFVNVIEAQDRILARVLPSVISTAVHELHVARGVSIHTQTNVASICDGFVELSTGETLRADHIIVGIGSAPNTELASEAGLKVDNGILVDECFTTSDSNIFAAGDCCIAPVADVAHIRQESWQIAGEQGMRAGQAMAGTSPIPPTPPWFWSDQFDHTLQVIGVRASGTSQVVREYADGALLAIDISPNGRIVYAAGIAPGHKIGREIKIIQRLMTAQTQVSAENLADLNQSLKSLLRSSGA